MPIILSKILVGATVLQSLVFAAFLLTDRFRNALANRFLFVALFLMIAIKADEYFQISGGLEAYPQWGFILAPLQPLMTPALYFFIRARTEAKFKFERGQLLHLIPFALYAAYLTATYFRFDVEVKRQLLESGALSGPVNALVIPIASDLIQLAYLAAALRVLSQHGLALRQWFSRIDDKNLSWVRPLLLLWGAAFALHLARTIAVGAFGARGLDPFALLLLDGGHFILINLMLLSAIADFAAHPETVAVEKYASSTLSGEERKALYQRAETAMADKRLFLDPDLTLQNLADAVSATARELSEAINGEGGESYYAFVNRRRIDYAREHLAGEPEARILDIALAAGFKSKSTFNDTFRRYAGETPSAFRARMGSTESP